METDITPFAYGDQQVRVVTRDGEPWFILTDLCKVLGLSNRLRSPAGSTR